MQIISDLNKILAWPLIGFVWLYQKTLSFDHGWPRVFYPHGFCKFYPSCSQYTKKVLQRDGIKGLPKSVKRIFSCTPASPGGVDLPYPDY